MKRHRALMIIGVLALGAASHGGSPLPKKMKCPVGGKSFTYITTAAMSQWGARPDGKPYGSWTFPMPLPECPGNGLVVYRDFSGDEVKALKSLLATPEYQQLRRDETPYFRAYWLMGKLGDPDDEQIWTIQQAAWESDAEPARKTRYQQEFVARARALVHPQAGQDDLLWIVTQMRAANALRELGSFDAASQLLDSIALTSLDVPVPAEQVTGTTPSGAGKHIGNYSEIRAAQNRRSWLGYAESLRAVIARRDASSEPLDMIPQRMAAEKCRSYPTDALEYRLVCGPEAMKPLLQKPD
jgi:hypothetical protein